MYVCLQLGAGHAQPGHCVWASGSTQVGAECLCVDAHCGAHERRQVSTHMLATGLCLAAAFHHALCAGMNTIEVIACALVYHKPAVVPMS